MTHEIFLTDDQEYALQAMKTFLYSSRSPYMLLEGAAGTGKTFLMQMLVTENNQLGPMRKKILGATLTHKARKILHHSLNPAHSLVRIPTKTIASLLRKQRQNSYLGTKTYTDGENEISKSDLIVVDEASMLSDRDLKRLLILTKAHGTKILFVGDSAQIPHPTQSLHLMSPDLLVKADSAVFRLQNRIDLRETVRQKSGNPILQVAHHIRQNLYSEDLYGPYSHQNRLISRSSSSSNVSLTTLSNLSELEGICFVPPEQFRVMIQKDFANWDSWKDLYGARVIAYTNQQVGLYNQIARRARFRLQMPNSNPECNSPNQECNNSSPSTNPILLPVMIGDLLMGYENLGWPTPCIENGQDYLVQDILEVKSHPVALGGQPLVTMQETVYASGYLVTFAELQPNISGTRNSRTKFFPNPSAPQNMQIFLEIRARAQNVNHPNSSTKQFRHYRELKDQLIFMESLYEYQGEIYSQSQFRTEHPLLWTKVSELIAERDPDQMNNPIFDDFIPPLPTRQSLQISSKPEPSMSGTEAVYLPPKKELDIPTQKRQSTKRNMRYILSRNETYQRLQQEYPNLIQERIQSKHMLGPNEIFADRFLVINKDIDYGYAITCHKSQGSTYRRVYVDDFDIAKIRDRWNYQHNQYYRASKERNQLKYVAITRAEQVVIIQSTV